MARGVVVPVVALVALLAAAGARAQGGYTPIKEPGRCSWYGECGKTNDPLIPGNLNCPDNDLARPIDSADDSFLEQLYDFCGDEWRDYEALCCDLNMLRSLISSMSVAEQLVVQCPACWKNFKTFYCQLTCSPNQSQFINVTVVAPDPAGSGRDVVTEAQYYIEKEFGEAFYDSCADVTFSMSNQPAMGLIGGGAVNYQEFVSFMGRKQFQGSPFDILFPLYETFDFDVFTPMNEPVYQCFDEVYACTCVDCAQTCAVLPEPDLESEVCYVGAIRCLPFSMLMIFAVILVIATGFFVARYARSGVGEEYMSINSALSPELAQAPASEWKLYTMLQRGYYKLGYFVATHPCLVSSIALLIVAGMGAGLVRFSVVTDPIELWSDPQSITRLQKNYFDETFGPFYRTEQLILSPLNSSANAIQKELFELLFDIEARVAALNVTVNDKLYNLDTTCFKPLGEEYGCVVYSVTGYWQYKSEVFDDPELNPLGWKEHFFQCTSNPSFPGNEESKIGCLPPFQEPIKPEIALGGYEDIDYTNARALVITWVINNSLDEEYLEGVVEWEVQVKELLDVIAAEKADTLRITYYTESGIELELARESTSDLITIAISYMVMLLYVSVALGRFSSWRRFVIDTKFSLGVAGVVICILSVLASVGLFSAFGVGTSLIIAEVIPFLVLAVGVDNIFILVNEFERLDKSLPVEQRTAMALSEVGPSITLSAVSETVAFSLGAVVTMPAVYSFAGYSAVAIFVDFLLQITLFLALLAADARRTEAKRLDCLPCVPLRSAPDVPTAQSDGFLKYFVRHYYTHFLLHPITKIAVLIGFALLFICGVSFAPYIELGLDQTIALPQDSYLIPYFDDQMSLLKVGVPVYFVISGGNATEFATKQTLCAAYKDCDLLSVPNILVLESQRPEYSTLALRPSIWMDDFLAWANPTNSRCCRTRIGPDEGEAPFCQPDEPLLRCRVCYTQTEYNDFDLGPTGTEFMEKMGYWLESIPSEACVRAGKAAYGTALAPDYEAVTVSASHYRTYHTVIQTQAEYINAYQQALRICASIEAEHGEVGLSCFPYTIFYVYFEQYETIVRVAAIVLSMAALAVFLVTWLVLGSLVAALWVVVVVLMIVVDLAGVMALWRISLNAISLVNMVMALGISVEFCSHIVRAFTITQGTREDRARKALIDIGASVFSGVTLTKFAGVTVLAFAQSQIFVIYYFRMYLSIVLLGFGHGLVLLPVLLSLWGPRAIAVASLDAIAFGSVGYDDLDKSDDAIQKQRQAIYA